MPLPVAEISIKHNPKGILLEAGTHSTSPRKSKGTPPPNPLKNYAKEWVGGEKEPC